MSSGPFLLSKYELSLEESKAIAVLDGIARSGFVAGFREFIGDRAAEFTNGIDAPEGATLHRWLDDAEAKQLAALNSLGNSRPYSHYAYLDGFASLIFPDDEVDSGELTILDPGGGESTIMVTTTASAIRGLERINQRLRDKPASFWEGETPLETILEFHNTLIDEIRQCQKANVLYVIGDFY